jgi:DNA-binding transcriptional LysR family regulator
VHHHELAHDRLVAVLAPDHPLAGADGLDLADLAAEPFVDFPYGSPGRAQTDQAFARAGLGRDVAFEVTDAPLMAQVIRHGLAIGFLPSAYLRRAPELGGLATATVRDGPSRTEYVIWGKPGPTPATGAFLTAIGLGNPSPGHSAP